MRQISDFAVILSMLLCYLGYAWAANKFCKKYLKISKRNELLFFVFLLSGSALLNLWNERHLIPYIISALLSHLFVMGLVLLLFQGDRRKKLLAAAILVAVTKLTGNFCESFLSCAALLLLRTVKNTEVSFLNEWEICFIVCIRCAMQMLVLVWMSKHPVSVYGGETTKWYAVPAVPLLAVTAVIDVADWGASNGIFVRSGETMEFYYNQLFSYAGMCVLTALSMLAVGCYLFGMDRIYLEQKKIGRYETQLAAYKMLWEHYSRSERLRHDMKNHIIALAGLLENKEWEKMRDYLRQLEDNGNLRSGEDITGNKAVDAILYQKRKAAEEKNITWECDMQMPRECHINEFDLCILFGNLLDNALEACKKLPEQECRFITIQSKTIKRCFCMEVKNSTDKNTQWKPGVTGKEEPEEHGIGLLNVADMVHKYDGVMKIEVRDGIFLISILLPLHDAVHDIRQTV